MYVAAAQDEQVDLVTLHKCLAHIALEAIQCMVKKGSIKGITLVNDGSTIICEACEQAKATCKDIQKECKAPLTDSLGVEVHTDLWGPSPMPSLGGRRYYLTFTNDYSHFIWLTVLCMKDETVTLQQV